jgi:large subunit ribosomal protein L15
MELFALTNTSRPKKKVQRVGRGVGSKRGKTSCRGEKGDGSRQGYRRRFGYEGGQVPLYRKLPIRGFTRGTFKKPSVAVSTSLIDRLFQDGDVVSPETLLSRGIIRRSEVNRVKIIGGKPLTKKVTLSAHAFSRSVIGLLDQQGISYEIQASLSGD